MQASKQIEIYEISLEDGTKAIQLAKDRQLVIGYEEADIKRLLQIILQPNEKPIDVEQTRTDEELVKLIRNSLKKIDYRNSNKGMGISFIKLIQNGKTQENIEVIPDRETIELYKFKTDIHTIMSDIKNNDLLEWYQWEVIRTIELKDRTRIIVHVP